LVLNGVLGIEPYFVVTAMVDDPAYLNLPFIRTYNFTNQPGACGWEPGPWPAPVSVTCPLSRHAIIELN